MAPLMYSFGIDLGGTFTKVAAVSADGSILEQRRLPSPAGRSPAEVIAELPPILAQIAGALGLSYPPPGGVGIGTPGAVNFRTGCLTGSGAFGWGDVPLGPMAEEAFGCDVAVDTDVNAGALADLYFGCARDASDMLYVSWGTGIGAGLLVGRKLYHTRGGAMCNLGHMLADPSSTRLCYCGCTGCLEVEAGGKAMVQQVSEALNTGEFSLLREQATLTPERISWAAEHGDPLARCILDRSAVLIARILSSLLALLNPDTVVFGGGVSRCFPIIRQTFDREMEMRTPPFTRHLTVIRSSAFGESAGVVGASQLPATHAEIRQEV
jgi:glucokinase